MTTDQIIQQKKNEVLKKIRQIYHPLYKFPYNQYDEDSYAEQRESEIKSLIQTLEQELTILKAKRKQEHQNSKKESMNNCEHYSHDNCNCLTECSLCVLSNFKKNK